MNVQEGGKKPGIGSSDRFRISSLPSLTFHDGNFNKKTRTEYTRERKVHEDLVHDVSRLLVLYLSARSVHRRTRIPHPLRSDFLLLMHRHLTMLQRPPTSRVTSGWESQ